MKRVIYLSSIKGSTDPNALSEIALQSMENNSRDNITGVLVYGDGSFLQVLEGPDDRIDQRIEKIKSDERHTGMTTLIDCPSEDRIFPDWDLGCFHLGGDGNGSIFMEMPNPDEVFAKLPSPPPSDVATFVRSFYNNLRSRSRVYL